MSDTKISALTALTGAGTDTANDVLPIVDTSATTTKKIIIDELAIAMGTTIATQAQMEAASSAVVTVRPSVMHFHPAMPKIVAVVNGLTGTVTTLYSALGTVSCVINSSGNYTVSWVTALSGTANMAVQLTSGPASNVSQTLTSATKTTQSAVVANRLASDGSQISPAEFTIAIYGDMS